MFNSDLKLDATGGSRSAYRCRLQAAQPRNGVSVLGVGKGFFSSPKRASCVFCPAFYSAGICAFYEEVNQLGRKAKGLRLSSAEIK
jgi:hypothetical protein